MSGARDRVRVAGPEAEPFLQGQLSQDIGAIATGRSALSFLLQPQGRVDALVGITRVAADEFVLDVDAGWGDAVAARLSRFKLRTKADIELLGPERAAEQDERARIEAGVPKMGSEIDERTIPAELGQSVIDQAVSFTKGCYTGQELVARIDSRGGHVPRQLRIVRLATTGGDVPAGAAIEVDGKNVGALTSVAGDIALGFVGRAVEPPADADIRWDDGSTTGRIEPLPSLPNRPGE